MKKKQTNKQLNISKSKPIIKSNLRINNQIIALLLICLFFFLFFNFSKYMPVSMLIFLDFFKVPNFNIKNLPILNYLLTILFLLFIYISTLGFGSMLMRLFKLANAKIQKSEFTIFSIGLGFFFLIMSTFSFGICGFLYKQIILYILILGCVLFLLNIKLFITESDDIQKSNIPTKTNLSDKIFILIGIIPIIYMLPAVFVPETFYDSLIGHIGIPYKWILAHKIYSTPYNSTADMPFNINMLYTIGLFLKDEILVKLIHFSFIIILVCSIYFFAKKFINQTAKSIGIFATAIFLTTPIAISIPTRSGIELGLALFEFLAIFSLLNYFVSVSDDKNDVKTIWLVIAGIMNGISFGGKYTSIISYLTMAITIFSYHLFLSETKSAKTAIKNTVIFCFVAGVVASPWYIRNLIAWGNPFVPLAKSLGVSNTDRLLNLVDPPNIAWTFKKIILFPWYISNGSLQQESFSGFLYLFFLPLLFFAKNIKKEIKILNIYAAIYMLFSLTLGRGYMRYYFPIFPVLAIIFAYYSFEKNKLIKQTIIIFSIPIMILNISAAILMVKKTLNPMPNFLGIESKNHYLSTMRASYPDPYFDAAVWINKNSPKNSVILNIGETRNFYIERQVISHNIANKVPVVDFLKQSNNLEDFLNILKKQKINYLLLNIPEIMRLKGFDLLYWDKKEFSIFMDFFNNYAKEVYKFAPDIDLGNNSLLSSNASEWQKYESNPLNFVYVYEIYYTKLPSEEAVKKTFNPFIVKYLYNDSRQEKLDIQ